MISRAQLRTLTDHGIPSDAPAGEELVRTVAALLPTGPTAFVRFRQARRAA